MNKVKVIYKEFALSLSNRNNFFPTSKISSFSLGVDKEGSEGGNPNDFGKTQSNKSEVRLREYEINRKY